MCSGTPAQVEDAGRRGNGWLAWHTSLRSCRSALVPCSPRVLPAHHCLRLVATAGVNEIVLRFHKTKIVRIRPNGDMMLTSGGWYTATTGGWCCAAGSCGWLVQPHAGIVMHSYHVSRPARRTHLSWLKAREARW